MGTATPENEDLEIKDMHQHVEHSNEQSSKNAQETEAAIQAEQSEHELTIWQAIRKYPKACLWSLGISMTVVSPNLLAGLWLMIQVMEAYENALIGSFFALPGEHSLSIPD